MVGLVIVIVLVAVPLLLVTRLSIEMLARLFGVVSHSEVATREEFARIREQLLLGVDSSARVPASDVPAPIPIPIPQEPGQARWRACPECKTSVSSVASLCVRCGCALSVG
ncbi:MAG TPA: hypothetical protein VID29_09520 [Solirubrobacteraceae bacterium]